MGKDLGNSIHHLGTFRRSMLADIGQRFMRLQHPCALEILPSSVGAVLSRGLPLDASPEAAHQLDRISSAYGIDALRLAMAFAAPPHQPFEWTDYPVAAAAGWLGRLRHMVLQYAGDNAAQLKCGAPTLEQTDRRRMVHETLRVAGKDVVALNLYVARVMTLVHEIEKADDDTPEGRALAREALGIALVMLSPVTPDIGENLWQELIGETMENVLWPQFDEHATDSGAVELAVQVNGRLRGRLVASPPVAIDTVQAMARQVDNVARYLSAGTVVNVFYVPEKLINFVVSK